MASPVPTRTLAGIEVPDTQLITSAISLARSHSNDLAFNHIMRTWLFSTLLIPESELVDKELLALATILHDLGWDQDPDSPYVSKDKRFEVDGAFGAREFVEKETKDRGENAGWDEHRLQLLWDAIALHTSPDITWYKQPECRLVSQAALIDLSGFSNIATSSIAASRIGQSEWDAITKAFPRVEWKKGLGEIMCGLCVRKPETTFGNMVGDWGERLGVEGYKEERERRKGWVVGLVLDGPD